MDTTKLNGHKRAVIVARVSTVRQIKETTGIESQLKRCREYCAANDFQVVAELIDTISGTVPIIERPEGKRLYNLIDDQEVDIVLFYTADRTARDDFSTEYLLLKDYCYSHDVELHYADTGKDENTMASNIVGFIKGQVAAEERRKIAERSKRGKITLAQNGKWPTSSRTRYGYEKIGQRRDAKLIINEREASIVRRIFAEYIGLNSKRPGTAWSVSVGLNKDGIPAPKKGLWGPIKVISIVTSPAYTGRFIFKDIEVNMPELRIIDDSTFAAAQERIGRNKKLARRNGKNEYLLSGYIKCKCGRNMAGSPANSNGKTYLYYQCPESNCSLRGSANRQCTEKSLTARDTEAKVWHEIEKLFDDDTIELGLKRIEERKAAKIRPQQDRLMQVEALLKQCDTRIERLVREFSNEDDETLRTATKNEARRAATEREGLVKERDSLKAEITRGEFSPETQQKIKDTLARVKNKVKGAAFSDKRYILDKFDMQLMLRHDDAGRWLDGTCAISDFRVELTSSVPYSR